MRCSVVEQETQQKSMKYLNNVTWIRIKMYASGLKTPSLGMSIKSNFVQHIVANSYVAVT